MRACGVSPVVPSNTVMPKRDDRRNGWSVCASDAGLEDAHAATIRLVWWGRCNELAEPSVARTRDLL
jgi:hypothetical protein